MAAATERQAIAIIRDVVSPEPVVLSDAEARAKLARDARLTQLLRLSAALQEAWAAACEAYESDIADDVKGCATEVMAEIAALTTRKVTS